MKSLRRIAIAVVVFASAFGAPMKASAESAFCEGFHAGYNAGWCYQQYGCLQPLPPLCPLPNLGESTYQDGYNRGFLAGLHAH
jgi:hypothetical protein